MWSPATDDPKEGARMIARSFVFIHRAVGTRLTPYPLWALHTYCPVSLGWQTPF